MFSVRTRYLLTVILYACACLCLLLIGWAAHRLVEYPETGASWSFVDDVVSSVDVGSPAEGRLQPGDRILTVNGVAPAHARGEVARWRAGEPVLFVVERNGAEQAVEVTLEAPGAQTWPRLTPLAIALAFWALGLIVLVYAPHTGVSAGRQPLLLVAFAQTVAGALAAGALSSNSGLAFNVLFVILMWWAGVAAVAFHLSFPVAAPAKGALRAEVVFGGLAFCGSVAESVALLHGPVGLVEMFFGARRLWLALCFGVSVALLVRAYRAAPSRELRRRVGIVSLGGGLALAPFLLLSLLPDAVLHEPLLPYAAAFLFLLFIPLSYGYAVLHYRLLRLDRYVSRTAAYLLVIALLAGLYLTCYALLAAVLAPDVRSQPLVNLSLALVLALAAHPLYRRLQMLVSRFLYGGWSDYRSAVSQIGQSLEQASDETLLADGLCRQVQSALQLQSACLLLQREEDGRLVSAATAGACPHAASGSCSLDGGDALGRVLQTLAAPVSTETLRQALEASVDLSSMAGEQGSAGQRPRPLNGRSENSGKERFSVCEHVCLWAPLRAHGRLTGVLLLGPQRGGDDLRGVDLGIVQAATQQAGIALENMRLLYRLRRSVQESESLHRQMLHARDEERKRLARDLHDQVIQTLVGLNYGLAQIRGDLGPAAVDSTGRLQEEVRNLLGVVRSLCADLRPPALDTLGLVPALRARLREVENATGLRIRLNVEGDADQELPETVSLCLFSVLQEALANVQRHAAATAVTVDLCVAADDVSLSITDNGRGFAMPGRLGELTGQLHFGLVGVQERVELLGGAMELCSTPGGGCRLGVTVPLAAGQTRREDGLSPIQETRQ